ncbi:MAG: 4-hydroxy-3-methylbut-2-enyl diphosphate reductase, partial [Erysipelotrichaceae bacterium]|nr:4-hydroxy-3-methylbut-2-enyl diphosphate reductase [Erysipelotrichaceae bacterium]
MNVKRVIPSGYCKGVITAIKKVRKARLDYPDKNIYVLGMIVHNRFVVDAFTEMGVITLDDPSLTKMQLLETVNDGVIVFTAHGISNEIRTRALEKGLIIVDASCEYVLYSQRLISQYVSDGYDVLYIGKKGHPEAEAACSISSHVHLLTGNKDISDLSIDNPKIAVTTQTTMSVLDTADLINKLLKKYPDMIVHDEICNATRMRQQAVMALNDSDCLVVVGDPHSNNTAQLARIGRKSGIKKVLAVEVPQDLENIDL